MFLEKAKQWNTAEVVIVEVKRDKKIASYIIVRTPDGATIQIWD